MPTNKDGYMKEYRKAKAEGKTVPLCTCGKQLKGKLAKARKICSACWKQTEQGKEETRQAVSRSRLKRKQQEQK